MSAQLDELGGISGLIVDAASDTILWLQAAHSAEEEAHVRAMQGRLLGLDRIITRRMERRGSPEDDRQWSETVAEVLSLLEKAREVRGNIVGKGLARLANHLPKELPGSKVPLVTHESQAGRWRAFRTEFEQLANEEERIERAAPKDRLLRAYCTYREHPEVWEKGKAEQGCFCLLKAPETGLWTLGDGVSENFLERFRALAARAGVTLGSPEGTDPEDFWLHRLWLDLRENKSEQLFAASKEGGVILRVCEASATFCSRLERKAVTGADRLRTDEKQVESSRAQNSATSAQGVASKSTNHRALVDAYIQEVRTKKGKRVTMKEIWSAAGYNSRTEFERWVRQDPKHPNKAADETFTRLLCVEKPHLK